MANNKLKIKIDADTTEALKQMKEVTEAANECVTALEQLERLTKKFSGLVTGVVISLNTVSNDKPIASDVIRRINDSEEKIYI